MTSLADLAVEVRTGLERITQREQLTLQLRRIESVDRATDRLLEQISELDVAVGVARSEGFCPPLPSISRIHSDLRQLDEQLAKSDVDPRQAEQVSERISGVVQQTMLAVMTAWRAHVAEAFPSPDGLRVLADAFSTIAGATELVRQLRSVIEDVQRIVQQRPTPDAVAKLTEAAQAVPQILQQLVGSEAEVRAFADELARGGASIGALTPTVLEWMDARGFVESFKIVAGRPAGES